MRKDIERKRGLSPIIDDEVKGRCVSLKRRLIKILDYKRLTQPMLAIFLFLATGCDMNDTIIKEMESAYLVAVSQKNDTFVDRNAAVSRAVQKFFPIGMKKKDALELLNELKENGFEITELKYEGIRIWPNKEFRHYPEVNREKKYPHGTTGYIAEKQFDRAKVIVTKTAFISIKLDSNDVVIESKGSIVGDGL